MTGDTKFTSGPWAVHPPIGNRRDWGVVADKDYDSRRGARRRIAWVGNASSPHNNEQLVQEVEANAHLITAAPDLYTALVAMVDRWEPEPDGYGDRRMWEAAVAALAKAKGEAGTVFDPTPPVVHPK